MLKDTNYIIKRIIIGVGIALVLMLIKGGLVMDVKAQSPFTIRFYGSNNNLCSTINGSYNVTYSGTGTCATIQRINIANNTYNLQNNVKYNLYTSIELDISRSTCNQSNLHIRSDSYIGNYERNKWIGPTTVTWNNASHITSGINGSCRYDWGYVQQFTSNFNSSGMSFDFYFDNNYLAPLHRISITRFELEVVTSGGSDTSSVVNSINNQTNAIINNNNQNTQNIIDNNNQNTERILDNNTDNSEQFAQHNFENFQLETHGLTAIVTAPLRFFTSLISSTCTPLRFPLPFVNQDVVLPCLSPIYQQYFPTFLLLYRLITDGVIGYWVCVKLFQKCKEFLDPQDDKVEVFDL